MPINIYIYIYIHKHNPLIDKYMSKRMYNICVSIKCNILNKIEATISYTNAYIDNIEML